MSLGAKADVVILLTANLLGRVTRTTRLQHNRRSSPSLYPSFQCIDCCATQWVGTNNAKNGASALVVMDMACLSPCSDDCSHDLRRSWGHGGSRGRNPHRRGLRGGLSRRCSSAPER